MKKKRQSTLNGAQRRTEPRVEIKPLHGVSFCCEGPSVCADVGVANLSVTGVALERTGLPADLHPGDTLSGKLSLCGKPIPVHLALVHSRQGLAGCRFVNPQRELAGAIREHFAAEIAALMMKPVAEEKLPERSDGTPHCFQGQNNSGLFYVEQDSEVRWFRVVFLGSVLEGGKNRPVRFGYLTGDLSLAGDVGDDREVITWAGAINAEQLSATLRFIESVTDLDPDHCHGILRVVG